MYDESKQRVTKVVPLCIMVEKYRDVPIHHNIVVVVALLFYVHGKHLRSCRDGQLT